MSPDNDEFLKSQEQRGLFRLVLENKGNLVICDSENNVMWIRPHTATSNCDREQKVFWGMF